MKSVLIITFSLLVLHVFGIRVNTTKIEFKKINYKYGTYRIEFDIVGVNNNDQATRIISNIMKRKEVKECKIVTRTHCLIVSSEIIPSRVVRKALIAENVDFDYTTVQINSFFFQKKIKKMESNNRVEHYVIHPNNFIEQESYIKHINQLNTPWRNGYR